MAVARFDRVAYCCYAPPSLIQEVQVSNRIISMRGIVKRDSCLSILWRCYRFFQFINIPERAQRQRCLSKRKLADNALPSILSYFTRRHFAITNLRSLLSKWLIKRGFDLFFYSPSGHSINRSSGYFTRECVNYFLNRIINCSPNNSTCLHGARSQMCVMRPTLQNLWLINARAICPQCIN